MNYLILVGRLVKDVELKELEDGIKNANITLAVQRPYKNGEGIYESDFITCRIWNGLAQSTYNHCKKGDLVSVNGRLQSRNCLKDDGTKETIMEVVAEKVTFLSSKRSED